MRRFSVFSILLFIVLSAAMSISTSAQTNGESVQNNDAAAERINAIFISTIKQGKFVLDNNVHGYTFIPPSNEDLAEIKTMGSKAIAALVQHLNSQGSRDQWLAIRFLGCVGGEGVVKPLGDFVLSSHSGTFRLIALKYLSEAPWASIREYVSHAANDTEPAVRKESLRIEAAHR
jgi:hypothetical protein